ncbi:hypothetical protein CABS02_13795 [Colletotrichum abscissum]|uniref:Uncharacterized protein n=1 Tax=Colletotrichum abscissum TaxID=1671311 RepID=A0A9P9X2C7_9PEZI|nr:hypothetical protein CABS02_13795 [Colletotrichum abscissum]
MQVFDSCFSEHVLLMVRAANVLRAGADVHDHVEAKSTMSRLATTCFVVLPDRQFPTQWFISSPHCTMQPTNMVLTMPWRTKFQHNKQPPGANAQARAIPISYPLLQHDRSNTIAMRIRVEIAIRQSTALSAGTCASPGRVGFPFDSSIAAVPRLLANFSLSTSSCWSWDVNDQSPVFVAGTGRLEARAMVLAFDQNNSSVHSARSFQCEPSVIRLLVMAERQAITQHNRVPAATSESLSSRRLDFGNRLLARLHQQDHESPAAYFLARLVSDSRRNDHLQAGHQIQFSHHSTPTLFHLSRRASLVSMAALNMEDSLPFDERVVDPSLLFPSGTGERDGAATQTHQDGRYHSTGSSARASQDGSTGPLSNSLWADDPNSRNYQNSTFLALPMETPTRKPSRKRRPRRDGNEVGAYTGVIEADEAPRWGRGQRLSEQAREAPYNDDNIGPGRFDDTTQSRVSPSDAAIAADSLLDFLGQPQAGEMIAPKDLEAVVRIWSLIRMNSRREASSN